MMIPPTGMTGRSFLDVLARGTRLGPALLRAPWAWLPPAVPAPPPPAPATPPRDQLPTVAATDGPVTDHALLVLLGQFAQRLGLVRLLEAVPVPQKTVEHRPQTKLIEFLVAILAGLEQLQELNDAPAPLVRDQALAAAWGQPAFAHYSGVSRTLTAADATTLQAVLQALQQISRPFVDREVLAIVRSNQPLLVDIDLTGRAVSPTSTDYLDAAFGWMDDAVAKGYQSAISSLSGGPNGRLLLSSQRYAGRAKSADCLQAAVRAVEQVLGLHPRRRTALVQARLADLATMLTERQQARDQVVVQQQAALGRVGQSAAQPSSVRQQQRLRRTEQQVERLGRRRQTLERGIWQLQQQQAEARAWLAQLETANAAQPSAVEVVMRLDAGFATDANLAWLIEMGYTVLTKAHSGHTTTRLQHSIGPDAAWERVGANAEALALGA